MCKYIYTEERSQRTRWESTQAQRHIPKFDPEKRKKTWQTEHNKLLLFHFDLFWHLKITLTDIGPLPTRCKNRLNAADSHSDWAIGQIPIFHFFGFLLHKKCHGRWIQNEVCILVSQGFVGVTESGVMFVLTFAPVPKYLRFCFPLRWQGAKLTEYLINLSLFRLEQHELKLTEQRNAASLLKVWTKSKQTEHLTGFKDQWQTEYFQLT